MFARSLLAAFRRTCVRLSALCFLAAGASAQAFIDDCGTVESDGFFCLLWRADSSGLLYRLSDPTNPITNQQMQVGDHFRVVGQIQSICSHNCWVIVDGCLTTYYSYACGPISLGLVHCPGDGSYGPCPCGNEAPVGSGEGCVNSQGHGGLLTAQGSRVLANADIVFHVSQVRPHRPGVLFQSTWVTNIPFYDGRLCVATPQVRLQVLFADANGEADSTAPIAVVGGLVPGVNWYYQYWYRDPVLSPCGTGSNLTNGLVIGWL
ncbi:MAG: hypothetical protein H6831_02865 [Planctomycetes bacterium]|nr:hypothetical protein [Planctomycetota bacterium]MCB9903324.1 hypothetical protein [Planctomycetota bacterium]